MASVSTYPSSSADGRSSVSSAGSAWPVSSRRAPTAPAPLRQQSLQHHPVPPERARLRGRRFGTQPQAHCRRTGRADPTCSTPRESCAATSRWGVQRRTGLSARHNLGVDRCRVPGVSGGVGSSPSAHPSSQAGRRISGSTTRMFRSLSSPIRIISSPVNSKSNKSMFSSISVT